jgi:carbamoyltransferase
MNPQRLHLRGRIVEAVPGTNDEGVLCRKQARRAGLKRRWPGDLGPRHPGLATAGFRIALPLWERYYRRRGIFRSTSAFAQERFRSLASRIDRGEPLYLVGIGPGGTHNAGAALIEVGRDGPNIICNNEEERFSGEKHSNKYPEGALASLIERARAMGIGPERIDAWLLTWDYPAMGATLVRTMLEEAPGSIRSALDPGASVAMSLPQLERVARTGRRIAKQIGARQPVPLIAMPHHDNHA